MAIPTYWTIFKGQESKKSSIQKGFYPLNKGPIASPETSIRNYHYTVRNIPDQHRPQANPRFRPLKLHASAKINIYHMYTRSRVNNYPHYRYKLYFNKTIKLIITPFFNTVSLLCNALLPSLHKLLYALRNKLFLAEQRATYAPLPSCVKLVRTFFNFSIHS